LSPARRAAIIAAIKEASMITEVITFKLRAGMTREEVVAAYRKTAPIWRANADCIRKSYLYDGERHLGGGAYLWKNLESAQKAHGDVWRQMINDLYGSEDQISITYFETPIVADNLVQQTIEEDAPALSTPTR
jgi:hypothetical protein